MNAEEREIDALSEGLDNAIREGDMHMALYCATVLHRHHSQDADEILSEACNYAGSVKHSPHLTTSVAPAAPRLSVVN